MRVKQVGASAECSVTSLHRRRIGRARSRADHAQVVVRDVGDREAVRRRRRERERESSRAPAREAFAHRVHRRDVEPRAEQQLVELRRGRLRSCRASGAAMRLDAPPEISTIATSLPRRPGVTSAIFAAAANEWRAGHRMIAAHARRASGRATAPPSAVTTTPPTIVCSDAEQRRDGGRRHRRRRLAEREQPDAPRRGRS